MRDFEGGQTLGIMQIPADGGCRCGQVRFRLSGVPIFTAICHCRGCQRMTGSAFSTTVAVPVDAFALLTGETELGGLHGPQALHHHCRHCKSWIFTRFEPELGFINVRATMLDEVAWFEPFVETYTSEALPWAVVPVQHSFPAFPTIEAFGPIAAAFASTQVESRDQA